MQVGRQGKDKRGVFFLLFVFVYCFLVVKGNLGIILKIVLLSYYHFSSPPSKTLSMLVTLGSKSLS